MEPTHRLGGTLDLVATFSGYDVANLTVDPAGVISDHSLVTRTLPSRHCAAPPVTRRVRSWQKIDRSAFIQAIKDSCLGRAPVSVTQSRRPVHRIRHRAAQHRRPLCTGPRGAQSCSATLTVVRRRMPGHSPCVPQTGKTISTDQDRQRSFCLLIRVTPA